LEINSLRLI